MKIMVIGGGGREHAIIRRLRENPAVSEIYALPGNAGIAEDATCVKIAATDIDGMVRFARDNGIEFAVVAPDDPLAMGAVDALHAAGLHAAIDIARRDGATGLYTLQGELWSKIGG